MVPGKRLQSAGILVVESGSRFSHAALEFALRAAGMARPRCDRPSHVCAIALQRRIGPVE
jgi:hypothetical protein